MALQPTWLSKKLWCEYYQKLSFSSLFSLVGVNLRNARINSLVCSSLPFLLSLFHRMGAETILVATGLTALQIKEGIFIRHSEYFE